MSARPGLRGGYRASDIPTAISSYERGWARRGVSLETSININEGLLLVALITRFAQRGKHCGGWFRAT